MEGRPALGHAGGNASAVPARRHHLPSRGWGEGGAASARAAPDDPRCGQRSADGDAAWPHRAVADPRPDCVRPCRALARGTRWGGHVRVRQSARPARPAGRCGGGGPAARAPGRRAGRRLVGRSGANAALSGSAVHRDRAAAVHSLRRWRRTCWRATRPGNGARWPSRMAAALRSPAGPLQRRRDLPSARAVLPTCARSPASSARRAQWAIRSGSSNASCGMDQ